jgi:hypothetical protein
VTDHSSDRPPLRINGVPLTGRYQRVPDLTAGLVSTIAARIPQYRALPREALDGDVTRLVLTNLKLGDAVLTERRMPAPEELTVLAESAAERAAEGLPLGALLSAYHEGMRADLLAIIADATADDLDDVREVTALLMELLQHLTVAVASAYVEARLAVVDQERTARQDLLVALLSGGDPVAAAMRAGTRLAAAYTVLQLAVLPHPDEASPGVDARIAGRRKLRRMRVELDRLDGALHTLSPDGGCVLLPGAEPADRVEALRRNLARAAGADVTVAEAQAPVTGIAEAARLAGDVLDVVRLTGRPPGRYAFADVLIDYQITRPGPARAQLAALLAPLTGHPDLLTTLATYLDLDGNRRRTATALHLHPNTVDYRLRRLGELTGLDPTGRAGLRRLEAALIAYRAELP